MFSQYNIKLGIGCVHCNHVWYIVSNDEEIFQETQLQWAKDVILEHYKIHEEKGYEEGLQE